MTRGHDDLAANFVPQLVLTAKFHHCCCAFDAKLRLQGAGFVVNARVNDAAVMTALVMGNAGLFLHQQQSKLRQEAGGVHRGRETYDSSPDNNNVKMLVGHNPRRQLLHVKFFYTLLTLLSEVTQERRSCR